MIECKAYQLHCAKGVAIVDLYAAMKANNTEKLQKYSAFSNEKHSFGVVDRERFERVKQIKKEEDYDRA